MTTGTWHEKAITNPRSQRLSALYLRTEPESRGWVVVCHGFTGSKEGGSKAEAMAEALAARSGFSFVLFDFAGNGQSEGRFEDLTLTHQVQDLDAVIDWCQQQEQGPVVTMGRSFGGSTVLAQAAQDRRVHAVCTWAAPIHLKNLFSEVLLSETEDDRVILADENGTVSLKKNFVRDLARHDLLQAAAGLAPRPLLIIHGQNDDVVPVSEAEELYTAAAEPKDLHIIPQADHQFSFTAEPAWEIVGNWLNTLNI
ncbi:MAG: alpha/beta hydrolase [Desulfovermiculus sp.]|nr:alpha/beta hydrolase [Desulfovermiculus sp.]